MRILSALAPTLKHLHIFFEGTRLFLLPSVNLPHLEELVVEGYYSYGDEEFANERLPLLLSLSRLRLTRLCHGWSRRQHVEDHSRLCS